MWTNVTLLSSFLEQLKLLESFIEDADRDSAALQLHFCTTRYRELTATEQQAHATPIRDMHARVAAL
jgi:deoxyadenosine/deoxycytidine kinase